MTFAAIRIGTAVQLGVANRLSFVLAGRPSSEYADRKPLVKTLWQTDSHQRHPAGRHGDQSRRFVPRTGTKAHSVRPATSLQFKEPE